MIIALGILVALGVGLGIWQQVLEQRRLKGMAEAMRDGQ